MLNRIPIIFWILILGILLRIWGINQSLWLDEATSIQVAKNYTYSQIINQFSPGDFHPPAFYIVLKAWITVFGDTEVATRMLSVLFGTITVYLVYLITCELCGKKTACISSLLLATSPLHIYYSQEVRMYAMATLVVVKIIQIFININKPGVKFYTWISLFSFISLLLYTDYLPNLIIFSIIFYLLFINRLLLFKHIKAWVVLSLSLFFVYLPWVPTLKLQYTIGNLVKTDAPLWWNTLGHTDFKQLGLLPLKFVIGKISYHNKLIYYLLASIPVALYSLATIRGFLNRKVLFISFWFFFPLIFGAIIGLYVSIFSYFRFIFVLPAFYILVATGAKSLNKRFSNIFIVFLIFANIISSVIYLSNSNFHREDWKSAAAYIENSSLDNNSAAVFVTNNQQDSYNYYRKSIPAYGPKGWENGNFSKIWFIRYVQPIFDSQENLKTRIESQGFKKADERDFRGVTVWEYIK